MVLIGVELAFTIRFFSLAKSLLLQPFFDCPIIQGQLLRNLARGKAILLVLFDFAKSFDSSKVSV